MSSIAATSATTARPTRARVGLAVILFVTLLISYFDRVNVSVLVADPTFLDSMGIAGQPVKMGMLMSLFLFAYGIGNIVLTPIGNWLGPRKAMALSILLWAVSVALGGLAGSFGMLLATRVLLGLGEGLHWPMQSTFVKNWFPPSERARANSAWLLGITVGPMIAIPLITAVVAGAGWRASFFVLVLLSLIPLTLVWFFTSDEPRGSRFANAAEVEYIEAGLRAEQQASTPGQSSFAFLRDMRYWLIVVAFLCSAGMFWGVLAWLPAYLKTARGFSWAQMGSLATLPYVAGVVTIIIAGIVADRMQRNKAILPVIALFGAAAGIWASVHAADNTTSALAMTAAIASLGIGLATYWTMMQAIVAKASVGVAAGVMNGVASLGSAGIPALVGYLIASNGGSFTAGLSFLVALGVVGGLCMLVLFVTRR
ncbi:MAG: MFS transporter [Burkholderiales bacterium]|uniref:MFS transporter n=2 Tax=Ottowia pentelensis TaxID=511108 RepID=A0ABV6PMV4_9BURK|nr:MFS transporter [Ottowia sp.]MBN9403957.1 MFS transporter [Burkholderiales bacterium]MBS0403415.1 MFS transporter [Pseudomonadota bacterium]MBS0413969.1 MFS transporter [Pseudomonadota bacterium]